MIRYKVDFREQKNTFPSHIRYYVPAYVPAQKTLTLDISYREDLDNWVVNSQVNHRNHVT